MTAPRQPGPAEDGLLSDLMDFMENVQDSLQLRGWGKDLDMLLIRIAAHKAARPAPSPATENACNHVYNPVNAHRCERCGNTQVEGERVAASREE